MQRGARMWETKAIVGVEMFLKLWLKVCSKELG